MASCAHSKQPSTDPVAVAEEHRLGFLGPSMQLSRWTKTLVKDLCVQGDFSVAFQIFQLKYFFENFLNWVQYNQFSSQILAIFNSYYL